MRTIAIEEHYVRQPPATQDRPRPLPEEVQARLLDLGPARIADMDAAGIDVQVLSLLSPGAQRFAAAEAAARAREENDRLADAVRRHPDRLAAFAAVPTADPAAAADELERAVSTLGFRGAMIHGPTEGRFLDDQRFWPILECAEALDRPIYIHPRCPSQFMAKPYGDYGMYTALWGFQAEVSVHAMRMMLSGLFERFEKLKIVIGHMGESIPFNIWRSDYIYGVHKGWGDIPGNVKPSEIFKRNFWITTSGVEHTPALQYSIDVLGADRVLWAIDYPYQPSKPAVSWMNKAEIAREHKDAIYHGNAERIFHIG